MKLKRISGDFFVALLLNMAFNLEWTVPAWILLALHFIFGLSIVWFWVALLIWFLGILFWMLIIGWAGRCSSPEPYKENKNPYSSNNNQLPSSTKQR